MKSKSSCRRFGVGVAVVFSLGFAGAIARAESGAEYRGIVSWQEAQQRCAGSGRRLPSVSELRGLLQNGLGTEFRDLHQGHNCSGGIAATWTSDASGGGHSVLVVARHSGMQPTEQGFSDGNRFHAVCVRGNDRDRDRDHGHGHGGQGDRDRDRDRGPGIQSRSFRCAVVDPIYASLQNDLRVVTIFHNGTTSTDTLFRFHFAADCQANANRLGQRCGQGGPCRHAFCEATNNLYTSLDSVLRLVASGPGGSLRVNQVEQFRFRSECNNALSSYP